MKRLFSLLLITLAVNAFATPVPPAFFEEHLSTLTERYMQHKEKGEEFNVSTPECASAPVPSWMAYEVALGAEKTLIQFPHPPKQENKDGYVMLSASDRTALYSYTLFNPPVQIQQPSKFFDGFLENLKKAGYVLGSYSSYQDVDGYWVLDSTSYDRKADLEIHNYVIVTPYNLHMLTGVWKKGNMHHFPYFKGNCSIKRAL